MSNTLVLSDIRKSFGGVPVLKGIDLEVAGGEVHAVLGENGAGKSTLMKIIMGVHQADAGDYMLGGRRVQFNSPAGAQRNRVSMVYQEFGLINSLSVTENIFLGRLPRRRGLVDWQTARTETRKLLERLGSRIDPAATVGDLKVAEQQEVEIARALSYDPLLLVMDEPSSALSRVEIDNLYKLVRRLKADGVSIVYISHKLDEVFALADRVTILRDGSRVGTWAIDELNMATMVSHIIGKSLGTERYSRATIPDGNSSPEPGASAETPVLEIESLTAVGWFEDVSLTVPRGKVVGVAGVIGAGKSELARTLVGALGGRVPVTGRFKLDGKPVDPAKLDPSIAKDLGIALVSEDRQAEGIVSDHTVESNMILPALQHVSAFSIVVPSKVRRLVAETMKQVSLRPADPKKTVRLLSGGNQQKIVIGKWLAANSRLLILDEPTRGIDVGARDEIYTLMKSQAAEAGKGILVFSSDLKEILLVSDEIVVMVDGRTVARLDPADVTEKELLDLVTATGTSWSRSRLASDEQ